MGYLIGILLCISLMINRTGLFFNFPLSDDHVHVSFWPISIQLFLKCVICSFLLHSLHSLHVLGIIYFSNKKLANIFSHFCMSYFHSILIASFAVKNYSSSNFQLLFMCRWGVIQQISAQESGLKHFFHIFSSSFEILILSVSF